MIRSAAPTPTGQQQAGPSDHDRATIYGSEWKEYPASLPNPTVATLYSGMNPGDTSQSATHELKGPQAEILTDHARRTIYGSQWENFPATGPDPDLTISAAGLSTAAPNGNIPVTATSSESDLRGAAMPLLPGRAENN